MWTSEAEAAELMIDKEDSLFDEVKKLADADKMECSPEVKAMFKVVHAVIEQQAGMIRDLQRNVKQLKES